MFAPPKLRVRIYDIDWILASPGPLDNSNLRRVPVLRIYGDSSAGLKTCVHVHQVYPYFYVEYPGKLDADSVRVFAAKLHHSLNKAISFSLKHRPNARHQYVRAVLLVKGVHFYGFHASYSPFLKIYFADPGIVSRCVTLLQCGTVMGTKFRVFESHISYPLQFMCDFALYGCAWIDMDEVWQRETKSTVLTQAGEGLMHSEKLLYKVSPYFRQTRMPLEVDVSSPNILNRHQVVARSMHHELNIPGAPLPPEPLVLSVRELWEDERRRRIARGLHPSPEVPVDPSASSRGEGRSWVSEVEYWDHIKRRIEAEDRHTPLPKSTARWERSVMTTFESIEALWDPAYKTWKPRPRDLTEVEVDEMGTFDSSRDISADNLDIDRDHDETEASDVDEDLLATQAVTQLITETEDPERQARAQDDEMLPDVAPEGEDDVYDLEHTSQTSSTHNTPRRDKTAQAVHGSSLKRRAATSVPTTPSRSNPGRDATSLSPSQLQAVQESLQTTDSPQTLAHITPRHLSYVQSPLSAQTLTRDASILLDPSENPFLDHHAATPKVLPGVATQSANKKRRVHIAPGTDVTSSSSNTPGISISPQNTLSVAKADTSQQILSQIRPVSSYTYTPTPPLASELLATIESHGLPRRVYRAPWYSDPEDAPETAREYAGLVYHLKGGEGLDTLANWQIHPDLTALDSYSQPAWLPCNGWEYNGQPPSNREARRWLQRFYDKNPTKIINKHLWHSQILGPTARPRHTQKLARLPDGRAAIRQKQSMTTLVLEVFALSREEYKPDPEVDSIAAIFYVFHDDDAPLDQLSSKQSVKEGALLLDCPQFASAKLPGVDIELLVDELDMINRLMDLVQELDPDVLAGWQVQTASWGYLRGRCRYYDLELQELMSRAPSRTGDDGSAQWGFRQTSTLQIVGRHVLNVWRIMRSEQNLRVYSFENVADHLLHERFPYYPPATLTQWFQNAIPEQALRIPQYFHERTRAVLRMLDVAEVVTKTAEFARVFGVDFFSVISRGSQYKVESFMLRIAKPESYVLLSPSKADVGKQNAIECIPLIMEPLSAFYSSPLVVLDFQSLYPSIMIAYNYCYSTCLGRVRKFKDTNKFGVTELNLPEGLLGELQDHIHVAPNGIMYVKQHVRHGLLGRMLRELLQTRVMVKQAMKGVRDDKGLRRVLDARQLGLKFISNVTYGYTSATYSGRMPAVEIADSIVQSGRETLEKAIRVIESTDKWGSKVVYGDTDSLFIYMPGKTKEQAFRIGNDIADTITALNPAPIKLKFEKVYLPCVLMAKKRYVGYKYENPDDEVPVFDAKGIETVRRDGCAAQAKMTEQCLKILFRTQDLSEVKDYCYDSWYKIIDQRVTVQDFIFAKEVKMGTYSDKNVPQPGVTVAARRELIDPNDEVQYGERVPYVIVRGAPGTRLLERAYDPRDVITDPQKRLDAAYYISRVLIPPLERVFNLIGADVRAWYDEMPKSVRVDAGALSPRKARADRALAAPLAIEEHFVNAQCILCGAAAIAGLCRACRAQRVRRTTITSLGTQVREREDRLRRAHAVCAACTGCAPAEPIQCESLDCAWLYERHKAGTGMELAQFASQLLEELQGAGSEQADSEGEQNTWQGRPRLERNGSSSGSEMLR